MIAVASQDAGLRMNPVLAAPTPTDDDGRYTIEGAPEGHFRVQAVAGPDPAPPGATSGFGDTDAYVVRFGERRSFRP